MLTYAGMSSRMRSMGNVPGRRAAQRVRRGDENGCAARQRRRISEVGIVIEFITDAIYCWAFNVSSHTEASLKEVLKAGACSWIKSPGRGDADTDDSAHCTNKDWSSWFSARKRLQLQRRYQETEGVFPLDASAELMKLLTEVVTVGKLFGSRKYEGLGQTQGSRGKVQRIASVLHSRSDSSCRRSTALKTTIAPFQRDLFSANRSK